MKDVIVVVMAVALASSMALAQSGSAEHDVLVLKIVREALEPALPYPASDENGELPANGTSTATWMVRPTRDGELKIDVLANPLNLANQQRAAKAMMQIGVAIEAAQKRSQASYDRAVAEAKRTGRSQDVDGVTLADEGVVGERIDAEARVTIAIAFNQAAYSYPLKSSVTPSPLKTPIAGAIGAVSVAANTYRDGNGADASEHHCAAETHIFFGAVAAPEVHRRSNVSFEIRAAGTPATSTAMAIRNVAISLSGNGQLIDQIVRLADWSGVRALVTPE